MGRLASNGSIHPQLVRLARDICEGALSDEERALVLRSWLDAIWEYCHDSYLAETLASVPQMLQVLDQRGTYCGDCDEAAIFSSALSLAAGLRPRYVVLGFEPNGPFRHVYSEALAGPRWIDFDVTRPAQLPEDFKAPRIAYYDPWRPRHAARERSVRV